MVETGWEPEQVGRKTFDQLLAVLAGIRKKSEMLWGKGETERKGKEIDGTTAIEQRLKLLRKQTGKKVFDLREVM